MKIKVRPIVWHIIIISTIIMLLFPIIFGLGMSFKPLKEAYNNTLNFLPIPFTFENYFTLFKSVNIPKITWNTFVVATIITFFKVVTSFLAAYAFVYLEFKGKTILFVILIGTMFIPFATTMIPNFLFISKIGLGDNIFGVIMPQLADAVGIFLMRQSMKTIPKSLIESAHLDNTTQWQVMRDIVIPLTRPAITSTGIWFFILAWNEYVWPVLILKSVDNYTLPLALQMFVSSEGGTNFTVAMAVSMITLVIPLILYLIFQRYIIGTFASSGIK